MNALRQILVFVLALALAGGAAYWLQVSVYDPPSEEITFSLQQIARFEALIAKRYQLQGDLRTLKQKRASLPGLFAGTTAPIATASVQDRIRQIVVSSGGEIRTSQPLPSLKEGDFEKIQVAYSLIVPINKLDDLLYEIESNKPYLFLDNVEIQTPQSVSRDDISSTPKAEIRWTVLAYHAVGSS